MITEIRWHGRGGQGTVTAAKVFADACLSSGRHVQAFPEYGPERSGAPLRAYNRIADRELRMHCPVTKPDIVVIADPTLIDAVNVTDGSKPDTIFLVNTNLSPEELRKKIGVAPSQKVFSINATKIALETIGRPLPNAALVGALARISKLVDLNTVLEDVRKSFGKKFSQKIIDGNLEATRRGYEEVMEG